MLKQKYYIYIKIKNKSLEMIEELIKKFEVFDDPNFKFDAESHKYTYNNKHYISVTQFLQNFHEKFDSEYWSKRKAYEKGVPQEWLLKEWKEKNDYANIVGSATHDWIENYFNKKYQSLPTNLDVIDRINKFNVIFAQKLHKLTPLIFERRIFSKKYPLAGTIDSIFLYNGKLFIIDWKTNSNFKHDDHPKGRYQKLLPPFDNFYQNDLNEYSIQVALYSIILEEWGIETRGAYLVHFGPDTEAKIYKTNDVRSILREYLETFNWN